MFLKLKESGSFSFRPEESASLSIVHVGPYLVALVCIPPFIDYLFRVCGHYLYRTVVTICTTKFTIQQFYFLPTQFIYVFCVDLRTNDDYFPIQH